MANKIGRPTKLTKDRIHKAEEYLQQSKDANEIVGDRKPIVVWKVKLPTIEGLANYLNVHRDSLYEWDKQDTELGKMFSDIFTRVKQEQAERLVNNGLAGNYNPVITKLLLSKHGYIEKQEQDLTHSGEVNFVNDVPRPKDA